MTSATAVEEGNALAKYNTYTYKPLNMFILEGHLKIRPIN